MKKNKSKSKPTGFIIIDGKKVITYHKPIKLSKNIIEIDISEENPLSNDKKL